MSARNFLVYGLLAGFVAGFLAFAVARTVGEPPVNASIAIEEAGSAHSHSDAADAAGAEGTTHSHEEEAVVSRADQSTWGLLTATVLFGTAIGGVLGLICAFAAGRLGRLRPVASTAVVVVTGFVAFYLVPYLKYPPNPPAVGSADTIGARTAEYFSMVLISIVAAVAAVSVARKLASARDAFTGVAVAVIGYVVVMTVAGLLMPVIDEVPDAFPADTLWDFRIASLATQAALWGAIVVVLTGLVARAVRAEQARQARRDLIGTAR